MIQALRDNIIVRPIFQEHKGLVEIPKDAQEFKQYHGEVFGEVVAIGKGYKYELEIGDKIIWQRHEGKPIIVDKEKYLVLKSKWVLAVIK
jgi:co-chaperonin GroES (HSP10)